MWTKHELCHVWGWMLLGNLPRLATSSQTVALPESSYSNGQRCASQWVVLNVLPLSSVLCPCALEIVQGATSSGISHLFNCYKKERRTRMEERGEGPISQKAQAHALRRDCGSLFRRNAQSLASFDSQNGVNHHLIKQIGSHWCETSLITGARENHII